MKPDERQSLILLLAFLAIVLCSFLFGGCCEPEKRQGSNIIEVEFGAEVKPDKEAMIESLGYDYEKDAYINSILDKRPIFIKSEFDITTIRYEELAIMVVHHKKIPYEQSESWEFFCRDIDGNTIFLQSHFGLAEHNVSKTTLNRIKLIALNYEKE